MDDKDNNAPRYNRILGIMVAFLLVVTAIEGYYLFWANQRAHANVAYASEEKSSDINAPQKPKDWHLVPNTGIAGSVDPSGTFIDPAYDPFAWNPAKEMERMRDQMDRMFEQTLGRFSSTPQVSGMRPGFTFDPKSDIEENDHEYIVRLNVPGTDSLKVNATLKDRTLTISGEREEKSTQLGPHKEVTTEQQVGRFQRVMTLPGPARQDGLKAGYKDGVLTITVPKDTATTHSGTPSVQ